MSKTLETRVEVLEARTGGDERELIEIIWDRDYEPKPGVLVITWLRAGVIGDEPETEGVNGIKMIPLIQREHLAHLGGG